MTQVVRFAWRQVRPVLEQVGCSASGPLGNCAGKLMARSLVCYESTGRRESVNGDEASETPGLFAFLEAIRREGDRDASYLDSGQSF